MPPALHPFRERLRSVGAAGGGGAAAALAGRTAFHLALPRGPKRGAASRQLHKHLGSGTPAPQGLSRGGCLSARAGDAAPTRPHAASTGGGCLSAWAGDVAPTWPLTGAPGRFRLVPFLTELRAVMDWVWTDTTLSLSSWICVEDIYAHIFILKCWRESEKVRARVAPWLSSSLRGVACRASWGLGEG